MITEISIEDSYNFKDLLHGKCVYRWADDINTDHKEILSVPMVPITVFDSK